MPATGTMMTLDEFLLLPDDGVERMLIKGELWEEGMTRRSRSHSRSMTNTAAELRNWLKTQPRPRGEVLSGDPGVILEKDPETIYGIDLVYVGADVVARQDEDSSMIDGVPILAVEILSPSNTVEKINEKIDVMLSVGVQAIWILDPHFMTVTIYQNEFDPILVTSKQYLEGGAIMPGFRVLVEDLFIQ